MASSKGIWVLSNHTGMTLAFKLLKINFYVLFPTHMTTRKSIHTMPLSEQFLVVGVGASAGGLDSFKRFIAAIPEKSGMAYVIVQHLSPTHESALTNILQRVSKIPVQEIHDEEKIKIDTVYVIPSKKILTTTDGIFKLSSRKSVKTNLIIDVFFNSLAVVRDSFTVGVVLSGTGSDGTIGLKMIKEYGGVTFAQDQDSAEFGSMPYHAVDAGVVDFVLPPEKIPGQILQINQISHTSQHEIERKVNQEDEKYFNQMLMLLHQFSGVDFIYYKQNTIRRRIARRMTMKKITKQEDYLNLLRTDQVELHALFQDLLIPVTSFFRDAHAFDVLCKNIFPALLKQKADNDLIRMWIAGCSTGEEAYSVAICLVELLGIKEAGVKIQIFASDISKTAIKKARSGIYSNDEIRGISKELLEKYFTKVQDNYIVNQEIRYTCTFAVHNFIKDPPFANMDFISCRNVFIYLDTFLQKKALKMFHYALNENGILMLGKSETVGAATELFSPLNNFNKIYSPKAVPSRFMHFTTNIKEDRLLAKNKEKLNKDLKVHDFRKSAETVMLSKSPASVIVNELMDIVHIHGEITPFLSLSPGKPTFNIFKMARDGLSFDLRITLYKAKAKGKAVKEAIRFNTEGRQSMINIEAMRLPNTHESYYMVFFKEVFVQSPLSFTENDDSDGGNRLNQELEKELTQIHKDMQTITEDHVSTNEELQSINEELQSSNEELQSLIEELKTSKDELQSANEELSISNQELKENQKQLKNARYYSEAIVSTIRQPLVVLDKNLSIQSVNESFCKKFSVSEDKIKGNYFLGIQNHRWNDPLLKAWLEDVLAKANKKENHEIKLEIDGIPKNYILSAQLIKNKHNTEELMLLAIDSCDSSCHEKRHR